MKTQSFGSKFGTLMVLAGSAVGLGNLWKFPYTLGNNGGAAFLIVYLLFVALMGIPLMMAELSIGRSVQKNAIDAFGKSPFRFFGILGVITVNFILCFYSAVGGWALAYVYYYATNHFAGFGTAEISSFFNSFIQNPIEPIFWQFLFMSLTVLCLAGGVQKGLERSSKIMMPILFVGLILLAIRAMFLPNSSKGIFFLFNPDFSKIGTEAILSAMGQAFFSLSLGMAIMTTFGSYLDKKENILKLATKVAIFDTLAAVITALIIFPAAFSFGIKPDFGASLIFITLPNIFNSITFGAGLGAFFFLLVTFAALTSSISILETSVSYFTTNKNCRRIPTLLTLSLIIFLIGVPITLSLGIFSDIKILGQGIFDICDNFTSKILLVVTAIGSVIYVGWSSRSKNLQQEILNDGTINLTTFYKVIFFLIRFIIPLLMGIILLDGCAEMFNINLKEIF